ncbi:MAG TPA: Eco57I restriction-modification methylase domain-containing protein [Kofleriaceae bacterium]|nr:Eco57I restriction-modification methylase domain-containing protein [Kofleriaceae bacterium]
MVVTRARPAAGVVYTPRDVCEPMVRLALAPLLDGDPAALRICDPAIGEGAFLIEIVRVVGDAIAARGTPVMEARRIAAEQCVHGVDIDPRAVAVAREAVESFVGGPVPALAEHLRVGDALAIEWPRRFDALVGNPPYIRQELLANKQRLRTYAAYDGVADLYVYFIELAQRIARRYCLIVPNKWMTAAYGRPVRELLAGSGSVAGIVDFARGLPLFGDADAFPCIVWGGEDAGPAIHASRVTTATSVADALAAPGIVHPRERWRGEPWHIDDPDDVELIERLARRWPSLAQVVPERPSRGVVTGCNRAFVIDGVTRAQLLADEPAAAPLIRPFLKGRDVRRWRPASPAALDRYILLVDRGTSLAKLPAVRRHLARYRDALEPRPANHRGEWAGRKPGPYKWYELQDPVVPLAKSRAPRLFYQDIQTSPACCLDRSGELVPDTTVWILPSADRFLLAVLNSPLYAWYARRRFPPALNGAVRPKLEYMRTLPIATPSPVLRAKIEALVARQLEHADPALDAELAELVEAAYELRPRDAARLREG